MSVRSLAIVFAILVSCTAPVIAEEPPAKGSTIPLKDIWAYAMPGTKELTSQMRDGEYVSEEGRFVFEIPKSLGFLSPTKAPVAKPGFIVSAVGSEAVEQAYVVFSEQAERKLKWRDDQPLSLVFFAHSSSVYVRIKKVVKHKHGIDVRYQLVPHDTREMTSHFAIIPLGRLPVGEYAVRMQRVPNDKNLGMDEPEVAPKWLERIICQGFVFQVVPSK